MAFGFFKKKESADIIYMNGHIYTQDVEYPWATAVACKGDCVMAVGDFDGMDEITGSDTEVVDLEGRYMFPGFIDAHSMPVLSAFADRYLAIDNVWDVEPIMDLLSDYVDECEEDIIFGYGFNEKALERFETAEEAHAALDEIERERPVILLGDSGVHLWLNSLAASIIEESAEEDAVEYLTPNYVLSIMNPLDFEGIETAVKTYTDNLTDKGFTAFFNLYAPDYFTNLYQDSLLAAIGEGEGDIKQKFLGSTYVNRPFNPGLILHRLNTAKTNCVELNGLITADCLKLEVSEESPAPFSQDALNTICLEAAEKGFNIHIDARDQESHDKAVETFAFLRDKGCKHQTLVLASRYDVDADLEDLFISTWPTGMLSDSLFEQVDTIQVAIDALTIEAAEIAGVSGTLGTIEKGKRADFTVFDVNPFDLTLQQLATLHADMTIIDGLVVYDADEAAKDEMCDMLFSMQL